MWNNYPKIKMAQLVRLVNCYKTQPDDNIHQHAFAIFVIPWLTINGACYVAEILMVNVISLTFLYPIVSHYFINIPTKNLGNE